MKRMDERGDARGFAQRQHEAIARLRLPRERVPRESLLRVLDRLPPLTQVSALPGAGKTTLLADWALRRLERGDIVLWMSAGEALNSVSACADHLAELVWGPAAGSAFKDSDAADPHEALSVLCTRHPETRVIVVIDDSEKLTDSALRRWLGGLCVQHSNLHLMSAAEEGWPLRRDVVEAHLPVMAVTGRQLMITEDEVPSFARSWGHRITPAQAAGLHSASGGWLQLLRTLLDDGDLPGSVGADAGIRHLRRTQLRSTHSAALLGAASVVAALGAVSPGLLDHLDRTLPDVWAAVGADNLSPIAETLTESGLLRTLDAHDAGRGPGPAARRVCLPDALAGHLVHELASTHPEILHGLHAEAARYYDAEGRTGDLARLIVHARRAEDWELLNRTAARYGWYLGARHPAEVFEAYGTLPEDVLERYPVLLMTHALARSLPVARSGAETRSSTSQRVLAGAGSAQVRRALGATDPDERAFLVTAVVNGLRQRGDIDGALRVSEDFRNSTMHRRDAVSPLSHAMYYLQSGFAELHGGDLGRAVRRYTRAYEDSTSETAQFVASSAAAHNAMIFAYEGRRDSARQWLDRVEEGVADQPWTNGLVTPAGYLAQAHLALDESGEDAARGLLERAGPLTGVTEIWPLAIHAHARLALLFGSPTAALDTLEHALELRGDASAMTPLAAALVARSRCDLLIADGELNRAHGVMAEALGHDPSGLLEAECSFAVRTLSVVHARLCHVAGRLEEARQAVSVATARSLTRRQTIELLMIDAAAALAQGQEAEAVRSFGRGLAIAERAGVGTALLTVDRDTRLALLDLRAGERNGGVPELPDSLFEHPGVFPARAELVVLTERERSVLRALAAGLSVAEIARSHVLSVNTVKKQTVSLYRKLGADNRTAALRRAYELRLLE